MANLFDRLFNRGTGPSETRADFAIPARSDSNVTPITALSLTAVYRAIQIIAVPISKMELTTYRFATGIEQEIDNPILVNNPCVNETRRDFLFQTVTSLAMHGEAFWLKQFNNSGQVNNLVLLPTSNVGVYIDPVTFIKTYNYNGRNYAVTEIEHMKLFSVVGVTRGLGPIQTCSQDIAGALDLRNYATEWFGSAGIPTGILSSTAMLNSEQADEVTAHWHAKQAARQVAVLGNGFQYSPVAISPKDALFTEVQEQQVQQIARLFGVPARLMNTSLGGASDTYTNLSDENQVFFRHTLMAYLDPIQDALSNCLPRGTRVEFDYDDLFKADTASRYNYYATGIQAGFLTPEYVQNYEGIDINNTGVN